MEFYSLDRLREERTQLGQLYNSDCMDLFKTIDDEVIDLIVTDCPYKVVQGGRTNKKICAGGIFDHSRDSVASGKLFTHNDIKFSEWLPEAYRVLKSGSHCYVMINGRNLAELQKQAEKVGFEFQNLLVWKKDNVTPNRYYMQCLEFILMLRKGPALSINEMGTSNFFDIPNVKNKTHPTEKPVELMEILIKNSSKKGGIVLDMFMGTGSAGVASARLMRKFIGSEKDEDYFKIAAKRIEQAGVES